MRITDIFIEKNAGVSNITYCVNPNDYMFSLVHDFGFEEKDMQDIQQQIFPASI